MPVQACFRQNFPVVTIYASLGEEALVHSLNEVSVNFLTKLYVHVRHWFSCLVRFYFSISLELSPHGLCELWFFVMKIFDCRRRLPQLFVIASS